MQMTNRKECEKKANSQSPIEIRLAMCWADTVDASVQSKESQTVDMPESTVKDHHRASPRTETERDEGIE